ncbi:MAG: hypothetical protein AAF717_20780 [Bacteroidota bacterium]
MDIAITPVPYWISVLFGVLMVFVPTWLITNAATTALPKNTSTSRIAKRIFNFYILFFTLTGIVTITGFFTVNTLPPRVLVFVGIPLLFFYLFVVQRMSWFKTVFQKIQLEHLILIHLFRFVGLFFFVLYGYNILPRSFAFIGGAGDIITAVLVIPTLYFLRKKTPFSKALVWIWNWIGLADILSVLTTAFLVTQEAIHKGEEGLAEFGTFPFSWIPVFAPATIIFLHILIFRKLLLK